jgi:hypothetical protein
MSFIMGRLLAPSREEGQIEVLGAQDEVRLSTGLPTALQWWHEEAHSPE